MKATFNCICGKTREQEQLSPAAVLSEEAKEFVRKHQNALPDACLPGRNAWVERALPEKALQNAFLAKHRKRTEWKRLPTTGYNTRELVQYLQANFTAPSSHKHCAQSLRILLTGAANDFKELPWK